MRYVILLMTLAIALAGLTACNQEASVQLDSNLQTAEPTIEAAVEGVQPTLEAAVEAAKPTVEAAVEAAKPTVKAAIEGAGTSVASGVQTAQPTLEAAAGKLEAIAALKIVRWQWTGTVMADGSEMAPADPTQYSLDFQLSGEVSIQADCNSAVGNYDIDEGAMTIALGPATLAECGEESLGSDFVAQLGTVEAFEYDDATLMLTLADGSTMSFAARKDM